MTFDLTTTINLLETTPKILEAQLSELPNEWLHANEGESTFSAYDVLGHLIHGELTDWLPRSKIILEGDPSATFEPYDRFAQEALGKSLHIAAMLDQFAQLRQKNLKELAALEITPAQLQWKANHPEFGPVTLQQLLSTWWVHDNSHIYQISRVFGKQYKTEVGPWSNYISMLKTP